MVKKKSEEMENAKKQPLFRDLNAEDPEPEATSIESLCMNCQANGVTRLLLTKIPFYKEIVVMSFTCEKCGYQNNEIQSGAPICPEGVRYILKVETPSDLNRQVVKSDYASIRIEEVDFEIPAKSQKGEITTIEGVIDRIIIGLEQDQPLRKQENPEIASKIEQFIEKVKDLKETPFTFILEDISGNSFIENPNVPHPDPRCKVEYFRRSKDQDHELGIYTKAEIGEEESGILHPINEGEFTVEDLQSEVLTFPTNCPGCGSPCQTNMKLTNIPHFKEVVIMATNCDVCGLKTNEVKSGGGIEPKGVRLEVTVNGKEDFSRDVLKSETCALKIPELDLEVGPHALGGRFTTVEGLLLGVKEQLKDSSTSHMFGDSATNETKEKMEEFFKKLDEAIEGNRQVTIILDDPAGNSYIQSMTDTETPDERLKIIHYERTFEQNEELGLNDMKTE